MSRVNAVGHFVPWEGGCLFLTEAAGIVPLHAHYALQIAFGSEPGIAFRTSEDEEWTEYGGAMVPSRQPHSMDASRVRYNVVIFVEPETREGRALTELYLRNGIAAIPQGVLASTGPALFAAWREQRSKRAIADAARRVIQALTQGVEPMTLSDERIVRAVAFINRNLDTRLTLEDVAAEAYLSPSRFRHLFVEQTGMALRPYILWRRFLHVWELLMAGESLSTAAHAAGFADAAHLTRTSRSMFGFPPSAIRLDGPLLPGDDGASHGGESGTPRRSG
ncbi:MAG TPA: AraC family transcriptional regulator [Gemmatimonadaceae bacterium]|jgi:AraC-like DNA-binding protein|nr:AraC family transcriptional regulator [Gemmatimonadaceae bacterium]